MNAAFFDSAGCSCYLGCTAVNLHWKPDKVLWCQTADRSSVRRHFATLWKAPRCLLLAREARRGSDKAWVCLHFHRGHCWPFDCLPVQGPESSRRGPWLQTDKPASQTGSQPHRLQSRSGARARTRAAHVTQTDLLTLFGSARLSSQAFEPNVAEVT